MNITYTIPRLLKGLATASLSVILTGCITADPSSDYDQTAELANDRTNASLSLKDAWSTSFEEPSDAWDGTSPLSLEASIAVALTNDPALRRELALVARKRAQLAQASLPPNPRIAFQVGSPLDGGGGAPAMVQILEQLTWLWTMGDRIDRQDEELQAMILDAARTTVVRAAQVREAYAEAAYDRDIILLRRDYVETTATTLRLVEALVEAGEVPEVNRERAAIDHHIAEAALASSVRQLRQEKLELLRLMGWPGHATDWDLASPLLQGPDFELPNEAQIVRRALEVRLDVAAAQRLVRAAEAELRLAGWSRFPEVEYRVNWNRNFTMRTALFNGGMVSVPILDNGYARIADAFARLETASLDSAILHQDVILQARTALNSWYQAEEQLKLFDAALVVETRQVVEASEEEFKAGSVDSTELLLSQQKMIQQDLEMLLHMKQSCIAWIGLETAVGGSFEIPLEQPEVHVEKKS
ncbi:MAG: TolC family protein [Planctomycetota bacterium]|nr:TolC family protein [Planctomycetota bacterium]